MHRPVLSAVVDRVTISRTTAEPPDHQSRPIRRAPPRLFPTARVSPTCSGRACVPTTVCASSTRSPPHRRAAEARDDTVEGLSIVRLRADIPDTNRHAPPLPTPQPHHQTPPSGWLARRHPITADAHQAAATPSGSTSGRVSSSTEIAAPRLPRRRPVTARLRGDLPLRRRDAPPLADAARSQARPAWLAGRSCRSSRRSSPGRHRRNIGNSTSTHVGVSLVYDSHQHRHR